MIKAKCKHMEIYGGIGMYDKIKSDISNEYYKNNFPNDGQRFVAWYLRNIHNLDTYEAKDCITDGAGDKQIDAVYIDNQSSTIYIIQGKFYSGDTVDAEPLREVLASWIQIKNLESLQEGANQKLKIKINEISSALEDDYDICFELITTSMLTESAKNDLAIFERELVEDESITASISVVDDEVIKYKYEESIHRNRPYINHEFKLESGKYMELMIGGTKAVVVALPLKECVKIPGIKDGSLFRKNVRQSLGSNNKVNKGIAKTIKKNARDFFFLHNGITAICSNMSISDNVLFVKELNVVNGCQSLSTIYSSGESTKKAEDAYILFRFYEINDQERADRISTSTNSQSAVKPRDLRSNDKYVLAMKKSFEQYYSDGYFVTKRGEKADESRYNSSHIVNLTSLGKQLIAWHSQRPTISYSETKIFDKYFDQLFHREYKPEDIQALNEMFNDVYKRWNADNPMGLNENLLAMKAYASYHQLFAISVIFCEINKMNDSVPSPSVALQKMKESGLLDTVVDMAGNCLNTAMESAKDNAVNDGGKLFVPQNWIKSKTSLKDIKLSVKQQFTVMKSFPGMKHEYDSLVKGLCMNKEDFESRWTAD